MKTDQNESKMNQLMDIRAQLEQLWPMLDFFIMHEDYPDYSAPIMTASKVVESMILLIMEEQGISVPSGHTTVFSFATHGGIEFIPAEIRKFLDEIRLFRNRSVHHTPNISYGEMIVYSEAFDCFVAWFILNSQTLKGLDHSSGTYFLNAVESFKKKIVGYEKVNSYHPERREQLFSRESMSLFAKEAFYDPGRNQTQDMAMILTSINDRLSLMPEINAGIVRIEKKVDKIASLLIELGEQITNYQALLSRQIECAVTEEEIDRILAAYAEECTSRLLQGIHQSVGEAEYISEQEKLIISMGASTWEKLTPSAREFLITAKVTYHSLIRMKDMVDYSGVCLPLTKAVELETGNRLCKNFLRYLKQKYPGNHTTHYPSALLKKGRPIRPREFTLGSAAYILCSRQGEDVTSEQFAADQACLMEYAHDCLMPGKTDEEIRTVFDQIADGIETVRKDYRNPCAHINQLQKINAMECFDLVVDVEKLLKLIVDSCEG